jgi:hypothetical protein
MFIYICTLLTVLKPRESLIMPPMHRAVEAEARNISHSMCLLCVWAVVGGVVCGVCTACGWCVGGVWWDGEGWRGRESGGRERGEQKKGCGKCQRGCQWGFRSDGMEIGYQSNMGEIAGP